MKQKFFGFINVGFIKCGAVFFKVLWIWVILVKEKILIVPKPQVLSAKTKRRFSHTVVGFVSDILAKEKLILARHQAGAPFQSLMAGKHPPTLPQSCAGGGLDF